LDELANQVGTHRSHLARLFRKHLGLTVSEYRRDRRLEQAYRRLLESDEKIASIAAHAGFADHAHFCRLFKSRYGLSPSEHRLNSRSFR
jgi:iron complex transport system substrate-binding protein